MAEPTLYFVDLEVGEVPKDFYQENGKKEIAYTRELIHSGKIKHLLVSKNRRHSMITFAVDSEDELNNLINGFPLKPYFTINSREVIDLAEMVRSQ
jgi:muconolactone delta-isomerase